MAVTLVVSNRKGGAGKTTVAVNLAAELAALGMRTLLMDLDSQGHCAVGLGSIVARGDPTVHDCLRQGDAPLAAAIRATPIPNLWLAPADTSFEHGAGLRDELLLRRALAVPEIAERFDVVVLDTPPSMDMLLLNALHAAHWVVVPFVPHPLASEGVNQLMRVLFKVISSGNAQLQLAGFVPVMGTHTVRVHRSVTGDVSHRYGAARLLPGIRSDIRLAEAFAAGQPVRVYAPSCRGAADFAELASHLAQRCWA
jgi:chromosome partitioning protein